MQKIIKFTVNSGKPIDEQIQDYLDDNTDVEIISLTSVNNAGDEAVIVLIDDGQ